MMVYSLRNLLVSFTVVILVTLLIVLYTFRTLRSQEAEQVKIEQSRDALQKLGPAIINMQEFESIRANYSLYPDSNMTSYHASIFGKLKADSANLIALGNQDKGNGDKYRHLVDLIGGMIINTNLYVEGTGKGSPGLLIVEEFKSIAGKLENENREILNRSYSHSIDLTRRTFGFV
ncbi:MAG: hypothetical protein H7Y42_07590, partial [Chitinophagaceae bacterium]|nr:hypothetical protein [Chitinophagaceae bacterium]